MLPVSPAYKQAVYNKGVYSTVARHFLPAVLLKLIDVAAKASVTHTVPDETEEYYSRIAELNDDVVDNPHEWGTLEDYQFLLDGSVRLMTSHDEVRDAAYQYGLVSKQMTGADGTFATPITLTCTYTSAVSTIGRTLVFDPLYDSVPKHLKIEFYRTGSVIKTIDITDNTKAYFTSTERVTDYDIVVFTFYSMTKPYRRLHLLEDVPGVYLNYGSGDVISITLNQQIDVFSEELTVGEIEVAIQNVTKQLNILNDAGFEGFLQRRQPITVDLQLVFPDNTTETVLLGAWNLTTWKSNKGALEATFTVNDTLERLSGNKYIKGTEPGAALMKTLYEYAEDVLQDAGITEYILPVSLRNVYTNACLPIAEHAELLRMIAQAGLCVVIPLTDGTIELRDMSPLVYVANSIQDGAFNETTSPKWTLTNASFSQLYLHTGTHSILLGQDARVEQSSTQLGHALVPGHTYYCVVQHYPMNRLETYTGSAGLYIGDTLVTPDAHSANMVAAQWTPLSGIYTVQDETTVSYRSTLPANVLFIDAVMLVDLTRYYGEGTEPPKEWCDQNLRFINIEMHCSRYVDPPAQDTLDYSILIDAPEVALTEPVRSIETSIYKYIADTAKSTVYDGQRILTGTTTFDVMFSSLAREVTVKINKLDEYGTVVSDITATALLDSKIYGRAATLTVRANDTVQILIEGKRCQQSVTSYVLNNTLAPKLISDAVDKTIDNELITYEVAAENVTNYAAYYYGRRYAYDFDWRQNPAVEVLDTVCVHDDFGVNKNVLITQRNIEYENGILSGDAKGVTG